MKFQTRFQSLRGGFKPFVSALLMALLGLLAESRALAVNRISVAPNGPDGTVWATAVGADGTVYLGGEFTSFGLQTGGGAQLDATSGVADMRFPRVNGLIYAVVPDGSGGWYIGGAFTQVGTEPRNRLAQINSTGALTSWNPNANEQVWTLAISGSTVYVGGLFTAIGGTTRNYLAAIGTDGTLADWNPDAGGPVEALTLSGSTVYVGGSFTTIGASARSNIAAVGTDGTLLDWAPNADGPVSALKISGSTVYVGGTFSFIGGASRNNIAAIGANGTATGWDPNAGSSVLALAVSGSTVYAGGYFTSIGGTTRNHLAAIGTDGTLDPNWDPNANNAVYALTTSGTTVYAGGQFTGIGGTTRNGLAAIGTDGKLAGWDPDARGGFVYALATSGSAVYAGGDFTSTGKTLRNHLAAIGTDGALTSWDPNADNTVYALTISGSTVYAGGQFTGIGGTPRNRLAAIGTDGMLASWDPNANNTVEALTVSGSTVYAGGFFTSIGGTTRNRLAAIGTDGTLASWNPNANNTVEVLTVSGNTVYAGGFFTSIGATTRNRLAGIGTDGTLSSWNPNANGTVFALTISGSTVYAGGSFTSVGGTVRNKLAAIGTDGTLESWNPDADNFVNALAISGSTVYAGGAFTSVGGTTRNRLAAIGTDGTLAIWNPDADAEVLTLAVSGSTVYAGGSFTSISAELATATSVPYLATLNAADVAAPTVSNVSSSSSDGVYGTDSTIAVAVTFSESVTVTGTPQILLETGATDRAASYVSGSGTATLTFNYTVQAGDTSADLDYVSTASLVLNGGTITDAAGNAAVRTLASPGTSGSLGANKAIVINTGTPTDISLSSNRVADAATAGTTIGTLSTTDADIGDSFTYSLVSGIGSTDNARFSLTGATLQVSTTPSLSDLTYSIRIRTTDAAGHAFEKAFSILVMAVKIDAADYLIVDRGPYRSTGTILMVSKTGLAQRVISTQFKDPYDIAVDATGNLIVADYDYDPAGFGTRGSSIFRLQLQTGAVTRLVSGPPLVTPVGIKVEADGKLLVVDADYGFNAAASSAGAVYRIDPGVSTTILSSLNNFYFPQGLALAPNGDIYVSDYGNGGIRPNQIIQVDKTTGAQTVLATGFSRPIGMAVESDGTSLVVVDAVAKKLIRVTLPGGEKSDISTDSQFIQPTHVAIEADGSYIVTDGKSTAGPGQIRIYRVNRSTGAATILSSDGFFQQPRGVVPAK